MRPKLQKQSALKLVSRIIPQLAAESVSKACFGVYTRDSLSQEGLDFTNPLIIDLPYSFLVWGASNTSSG